MVKYKDVTQTGPKALKGIRNPDLYNRNNTLDSALSKEQLQGLAESAARSKIRNYDVSHGHIGYEDLSDPTLYKPEPFTQESGLSNYGESSYDTGLLYNPTSDDVTNQRAANEPWYTKLAAGVGKGIALTGTTFLDGTLGLLSGVATGIDRAFNGEGFTNSAAALFDNEVSNGISKVNQALEELMPNYQSTEEQENPWYKNLGTTNFWADSFLKNLGFSVGAFYSGGAFTKALKGLGLLSEGSTYGAKLAGSIYSAVNEGRIEANNTENDLIKLYQKQTDDAYNQRYNEVINSNLNNNQKQIALQQLSANKQKVEDENLNRARTSGLIDLLGNTILLGMDNYAEFGRLYARGFKNARGLTSGLKDAEESIVNESLGKRILGNAGEYVGKKITPRQAVLSGLGKAGLEGNEELAQQMISNFSGNTQEYDSPDAYYKALKNPNSEQKTTSALQALAKSFADSYGNGDQWEQFAVGALTGLLGMPTFGSQNNTDSNTYLGRGKAVGLSGGLIGDITHAKATNQEVDEETTTLNRMANKILAHKGSMVQSQSFTDAMNGFAADNNAFEYKNAEDNDLFAAINKFSNNGKLDDLKQLVNQDFDNISDEDLNSIAQNHTPDISNPDAKIGGWRDTDGNLLSSTDEGKEKMKDELKKKRDTILSGIDSYKKSLDSVRSLRIPGLTEDETSELAWLDWKTNKFDERAKQIDTENTRNYNLLRTHFNSVLSKTQDMNDKDINIIKDLFIDPVNRRSALKFISTKEGNDILNSKEFYDKVIAGSGISMLEFKDMSNSIKDLSKLQDASKTFSDRLQSIIENPNRLKENRTKVDEKAAKVKDTVDKVKQFDDIANSSVSDIVNKSSNNQEAPTYNLDFEDLDNIDFDALDDIESPSDNNLVQSNPETKAKLDEANNIKATTSKALVTASQLSNKGGIHPQTLQDFNALLNYNKSLVNSTKELKDVNSEAWNNVSTIVSNEDYAKSVEEIGEEKTNEILQERIDRARELANKVFDKLNGDAVSVENMKSPITTTPSRATASIINNEDEDEEEISLEDLKDVKDGVKKATFGEDLIVGKDSSKVESVIENKKRQEAITNNQFNLSDNDLALMESSEAINKLAPDSPQGVKNKMYVDLARTLYTIKSLIKSKELTEPKDVVAAISSMSSYEYLKNNLGDAVDAYLTSKYLEYTKDSISKIDNEKPADINETKKEDISNANTLKDKTPITVQNTNNSNIKDDNVIKNENTVEDDIAKRAKESLNRDKNYWKPTTTEIPIHWEKGQPIETYYDSITRPDENGITLAEKRRYSPQLMKRMKAVTDYLKSTSAYFSVNHGAIKEPLGKEKGSTIEFFTSKKLNKEAGETVILMRSEGKVVGDVASIKDPSTRGQVGLSKFIENFEKEFSKDKSTNDEYVYPETTTVSQYLIGKVPYTVDRNQDNTLNDIATNVNGGGILFKLGIALRDGAYAPYMTSGSRRAEEGRSDLDKSIQSPLEATKGETYFLLPTGGNKKAYVTIPFHMPYYTRELDDTKIGKVISDIITKTVTDGKSNVMNNINELENFLGGKIHINFGSQLGLDTGMQTTIKVELQNTENSERQVLYQGVIGNNTIEDIKNSFVGTPIQISRKYINDTYNGEDYNRIIGEIAKTNLPKGQDSTIGNAFTIIPIGEKKANRIPTLGYNPKYTSDKYVQVQGKTERYNIDRQTYQVTDSKNRVLDPNEKKTALIAAEGFGIITNQEPGSTYRTPFGLYDSSKHQMIESSPEEDIINKDIETTSESNKEEKVNYYTEKELDKKAKSLGLLNSKIRTKIWDSINDDVKYAIVTKSRIIASNLMNKLKANMDKDGNFKDDPISLVTGKLFKEAIPESSIWNKDKELKWLNSKLPNLSSNDHLRIVNGLIRIVNKDTTKDYYGMFEKGIITIADKAARGTLFHEAFHAVSNTLLSPKEHGALITEAKKVYNANTNIQAEEALAEAFRKYTQLEQAPITGIIIRTFRTLKHIINNIRGNESVIRSTFYNINRGTYGDRKLHYDTNINYSSITDRVQSTLDSITNNPRVFSKGPKSIAALSSIDDIKSAFRNQNIDIKLKYLNNKWQVVSANTIDNTYNEINQYSKDRYNYSNLSKDNQDYIKERGISLDEYRNMSNLEKEVLFKCKGV